MFEDLGRRLGERPVTEAAAVGEIVSLEASLRIDQRQAQRADELLATAALAFEYVNDRAGLARTWIKRANLLQALDQPEDVLTLLDEAASLLATNSTPYLTICTVTGRVTSLCDLDRPAEARQLLRRNLDAFEADEGPHAAALLRFLEGRVSLELGEYVAAQEYFASCIDGMFTVGRAYDAALAALYLGETLYLQGRNRELRALAARLLPEFSSRGVARETIAVLQLFSRAVGEESVTSALLRKLRRRLSASQVRSPATSL